MKIGLFVIVAMIVAVASSPRAQGLASLDDTARFLAGMTPSAHSPLAEPAREMGWRNASTQFNAGWRGLDQFQLPKIRAWSKKNLSASQNLIQYMFSGPDFIYADALFSHAAIYVLSGFESVGEIPDILAVPVAFREHAVACVRAPFDHFQNFGIFVSAELEATSKNCELSGTLPLLLIALVHASKSIRAVEFIEIDQNGSALQGRSTNNNDQVRGVRIEFANKQFDAQTLYYFSTDLSNAVIGTRGFLKFTDRLGNGTSLLKAASYLLHEATFSQARSSLLDHSTTILQDDSGIPLKYFRPNKWITHTFGNYRTPPMPFQSYDQSDLRALFHSHDPQPIQFGFGYRWRAEEANLLLATLKSRQ